MNHQKMESPTPDHILQTGLAFWSSKTLLSAVELELFTALAEQPEDLATLQQRLGLHPRSARDFLDALVALRMLARRGDIYENTPETDHFLDRCQAVIYRRDSGNGQRAGCTPSGGSLTGRVRTGQPQNEVGCWRTATRLTPFMPPPPDCGSFLSSMTGPKHGRIHQAIASQVPVEGLPHVSRHRHCPGRPAPCRSRWPTHT